MTSYVYDDFGQMLEQQSPVTGLTSYRYDLGSNLISTTDANLATTSRTYDAAGRVTSAISTSPSAPTESVSWTYDANGTTFGKRRLGQMIDPSGTTTYAYERRGLLQSETRQINGTTYVQRYEYDGNGNRDTVVYPSGRCLKYTFDHGDRPVKLFGNCGARINYVDSATYLPFGPLTSLTYGNGAALTKNATYDNRYRMLTNKLTKNGSTLASYGYSYDPTGNITAISDLLDPTYDRGFGYDDLNRLTSANTGASLWGRGSYAYDAMGNLTESTLGTFTKSFLYQGTTPLLQSITANRFYPGEYSYDAAGNEVGISAVGLQTTIDRFGYSARNHLVGKTRSRMGDAPPPLCIPGEDVCPGRPTPRPDHHFAMFYDGRGIRTRGELRQFDDASCQKFVWLVTPELRPMSMWYTVPAGAPEWREHIWFGDLLIARENGNGAGSRRFTFTDHLGTPILQTNATGGVIWRMEYEPYGNVYAERAGSRADETIRFPGQEVAFYSIVGEEENYNIFRWYRSGWGRYTQADPLGIAEDENLYGYALANPIGNIDPDGRSVKCVVAVAVAGFVLAIGAHYYYTVECDWCKNKPPKRTPPASTKSKKRKADCEERGKKCEACCMNQLLVHGWQECRAICSECQSGCLTGNTKDCLESAATQLKPSLAGCVQTYFK